ncbi:hypothetical protein HAX54_005717 [Datura stramonium]|uniref:Uncharacterized protein n=1 Tax=Datura stramonium TaxID=4076 RepID=A0ABS8RUV2_DATST|nr:hypothetical protein [Datura stramonium]
MTVVASPLFRSAGHDGAMSLLLDLLLSKAAATERRRQLFPGWDCCLRRSDDDFLFFGRRCYCSLVCWWLLCFFTKKKFWSSPIGSTAAWFSGRRLLLFSGVATVHLPAALGGSGHSVLDQHRHNGLRPLK